MSEHVYYDPSRKKFSDQYKEYIKSDAWMLLRTIAIDKAGHRCQVCRCYSPKLEVHHKSYARLGHEPLEDLVVVCVACHSDKEFKKRQTKIKRMTTWASNFVPGWRYLSQESLEREYDKFVKTIVYQRRKS